MKKVALVNILLVENDLEYMLIKKCVFSVPNINA